MSHPGIRGGRGSGRRGRPSAKELAAYAHRQAALVVAAALRDAHRDAHAATLAMSWDELEAAGLCDCGQRLEGHPPLPKSRPLRSWKSTKEQDPKLHPSIWTGSR